MTEALIVINLLVYMLGLAAHYWDVVNLESLINFGHLGRLDFKPHQLVTYQFLHDPSSIWHVAFNMLFLWVFGSAVEDRLGHIGFLAFYLVGGAIAGATHMAFDPSPVIGASGSVAAVSGGFLAFFPRSRIQVLRVTNSSHHRTVTITVTRPSGRSEAKTAWAAANPGSS